MKIEIKLIKKFLFFIFITLSLDAKLIDFNIKPDWLETDEYMDITILDSKELKFDSYKKIKFREISALAFKDNILYALNDKSDLFKFKLEIKDNKIRSLELEESLKLKDENGEKLSKLNRDSEGMLLVENKLLISFEKNPRVEIYSLNARRVKNLPINKKLRDIEDYIAPNKALESLAYNRHYCLITMPETPFKSKHYHTLYAKERSWKFQTHGSVTALEFIDENRVLVLERNFNYFTRARKSVLSVIDLRSSKKICKSRVIARFKSSDGWHLDNFEGLTKIGKNRFLIISDDNESFFQKTLLVLFSIDI